MNTTQPDLERLEALLLDLEGVEEVIRWTKREGRERLYIKLAKCNGGVRWNRGEGRACYVDLNSHTFVWQGEWAGAATRNFHYARNTEQSILDAIRAVWAT